MNFLGLALAANLGERAAVRIVELSRAVAMHQRKKSFINVQMCNQRLSSQ
jgi:hypothetical protein